MNFLQKLVAQVFRIETGEKVREEVEKQLSVPPASPPPTPQELIAEMMGKPKRGTHSDEVIQDAINREIGHYEKTSLGTRHKPDLCQGPPKESKFYDGKVIGKKRPPVFSEWLVSIGLACGNPIDLNRRVTWGGDCYLDFTVNKDLVGEARIIRWIMNSDPMWLAAQSVGVPLLALENTEVVKKRDGTTEVRRLKSHEILKQLKVLDDEDFTLIDQDEKILRFGDYRNA